MRGFVQAADRQQRTLLPECLDDWVAEGNSIRAVDVFVDALELRDLGFDGVDPAATGRPAYHPSPMLKLYIYGSLNRVPSSRRREREQRRNLEVSRRVPGFVLLLPAEHCFTNPGSFSSSPGLLVVWQMVAYAPRPSN